MRVVQQTAEAEFLQKAAEYTPEEVQAMQRTVLNIFERWGVRDVQASVILGGMSSKTLTRWRQGQYGRVQRDLADRMSYILGIHKALRIIFIEPQKGYDWIKSPNTKFAGRSPLDLLLQGGVEDLRRMRLYLDSVRGGW